MSFPLSFPLRPDPCPSCPLGSNPACRGRRNVRWCQRAEADEPGIDRLLAEVSGLVEREFARGTSAESADPGAVLVPPGSATRPDDDRADPATVEARLAACRACDRRLPGPPERCGMLVARGLAGALLHERGVTRRLARCPDGRWGEDAP